MDAYRRQLIQDLLTEIQLARIWGESDDDTCDQAWEVVQVMYCEAL